MRNFGVVFTGSNREGEVWPPNERIVLGISSLKYGYFVKDCKDERKRRMLSFLVPIFSPEKPYNITLILATTLFFAYSEKKVVDWKSIIGELVHRLATNTKRGQPSYIGHFFYHFYAHENLLTYQEETQWTLYQFMRELQTTDSEPEMGHEASKEEDMAEFTNEERTVIKSGNLCWEIGQRGPGPPPNP